MGIEGRRGIQKPHAVRPLQALQRKRQFKPLGEALNTVI
jgi:hypothetical protein